MGDLGAQLNALTPEQRKAVMIRAQQEANQAIMKVRMNESIFVLLWIQSYSHLCLSFQQMVESMVKSCFEMCAGTSVR
jgi:hypothetical protein